MIILNNSLMILQRNEIYGKLIKRTNEERGLVGMSRVCEITGKGPLSGNNRSHSLRATRRKWNVNLQNVTLMVDGKPKKVRVSARALRTLKSKTKAVA